MSANVTESDGEQRRNQWLTRLADEVEQVERAIPARWLSPGIEYPKWVEKVERELSLVLFPAAKLKAAQVMTPRRMGALIGHGCGMAVWLWEWIESQDQVMDGNAATLLPGANLEEVNKADRAFSDWYNAARRLAKRSLCSCVDQSYEDMRDFLLGYAEGFARKPKTFKVGEMGNPTFEIYLFLMIYWRAIEGVSSVRQLHEGLVRIFGANRVGDQKRVEKICQRIGLSFRKPGRPKKE